MAFLEVDDIHTYYGNIQALKGISLEVERGRVRHADRLQRRRQVDDAALDLRADAAARRARSGSTARRSRCCRRRRSCGSGICQSPEGRRCFQRMTVRENLELGAFLRRDSRGIGEDLDRVFDLFPRLKEREAQKAGTMSGGEQQMLAIGRALMGQPKLLLLDEPSMGIAPILVERIYETIAEINKQGMTILLVEQNANFALDVSKRGYVLETGKVVMTDESASLRTNPEVQKAYLGHMTALRAHGRRGAVAALPVAAVGDPRLVPVRAEGLRREARAWRSACCCRSSARSSGSSGRRSRTRSGRRSARGRPRQGRPGRRRQRQA